jgi:hypothetical protein
VVDVRGRRPETLQRAEPGRLVEAGGLKVILQLLEQPEAATRPYRALARETGTALGTVANVLRELRIAGHLVKGPGDAHRLEKRTDLLDLFIKGYALKLRPACRPARYRHEERDPRRLAGRLAGILKQRQAHWAVTGGVAGGEMTRHLETDTLAIFLDDAGREALKGERMLPAPEGGNLTILEYFAPCITWEKAPGRLPLATPHLVYAELLQDGRPREVETAHLIYDRFLTAQYH